MGNSPLHDISDKESEDSSKIGKPRVLANRKQIEAMSSFNTDSIDNYKSSDGNNPRSSEGTNVITAIKEMKKLE